MDIQTFNSLSLIERTHIAWDNGKHLKTLDEKDKCFSVYSFADYYIVIHYMLDLYDIKWVKGLKSDKSLEDFLKELEMLDSNGMTSKNQPVQDIVTSLSDMMCVIEEVRKQLEDATLQLRLAKMEMDKENFLIKKWKALLADSEGSIKEMSSDLSQITAA